MVSAAHIDLINNVLKDIRKNEKPFGGIAVVFVGDLFQLPPIVSNSEEIKFFNHRYKSKFFFSAEVFTLDGALIESIELKTVRRQEGDQKFIDILNTVRVGATGIEKQIDLLNEICHSKKVAIDMGQAITLAPRNATVEGLNAAGLQKIDSELYTFKAKLDKITLEQAKGFQAPDILELKVGAKVVFVHNNDPHWINGSMGEVTEIVNDEHLKVKVFDTGAIEDVSIEIWEKLSYFYNQKEKRINSSVIGTYTQFPLRLGYAITIHKSQGLTFEKLNISLDGGSFAEGQTYVALSRCRAMDGLKLIEPITKKDVKVNQSILEFYSKIFPNRE